MELDPRAVFERLFGATDSTDVTARLARIQSERSVLDAVTQKVKRLENVLGSRDRAKVGEYLDAVRDVERRIQKAEEQSSLPVPLIERPTGIPDTFEAHAKLLYDLVTLAFQTDMTRVFTFMMGREVSGRAYPEIGVPDPHHPMSHHQNNPDRIEKLTKINTFHISLLAHFLKKLESTPDGEGTLLDNLVLTYGSGISEGNTHAHDDLPVMLVGGINRMKKAGRYVRAPQGTPLANLHLTVLDKLGMPVERFGDSTGNLELLDV
jgi:hypothetical protein